MIEDLIHLAIAYYAIGVLMFAFCFFLKDALPESDPNRQAFERTLEELTAIDRRHLSFIVIMIPIVLPLLVLLSVLGFD